MLSETEVARDIYTVEKATPSKRSKAPEELAFEEIIKNNTLSPCSFNEFMDYLVCEESNAELLQFFAWFCRYVERWSEMTAEEKDLSPPWKPTDPFEQYRTNLSFQNHRRAGSDRLDQILEILDRRNANGKSSRAKKPDPINTSMATRNFSTPRRLSGTQASQLQIAQNDGLEKQAAVAENSVKHIAKQPFRDEIDKMVNHYIQDDAPRKLKIPNEDLRECLCAVQTTTHPSALLPAFTASETILKSRSHANFLRKSQRNACTARLVLVQAIGSLLFLLGVAADVVLILSSLSRFSRLMSLVLWWPGLTFLFSATNGVCLFLYVRNLRQLRPWEQVQYGGGTAKLDDGGEYDESRKQSRSQSRSKRRGASGSPDVIDPLRKSSMQTFGEANNWEREARTEGYGTKPLLCKIMDETGMTQNKAIRLIQNRVVLLSFCWAGVVSMVLTTALLFIPSVRLL